MTVAPEPAAQAVYAPAPSGPTKFNRVGLVGLLLVILALLAPFGFLIGGIATIANDVNSAVGDNAGWAAIGAIAFMLFGAAVSAPVALVGAIVGIVSLFRRGHGKVLGIVAIVLGVPYGLIFLLLLPTAISLFSGG